MRTSSRINPVVRATGIIGATAALVTGITFAALSSSATLSNNTIASASADLQISSSVGCVDGITGFGTTAVGFNFAGVVPGGASSQTETFCLKNAGTAPLSIAANSPSTLVWTVLPSGSVDNGEVTLDMNCNTGSFVLSDSLQNVNNTTVSFTGANLAAGATAVCTAKVTMSGAAFTGSSAALAAFNLVFSGTGGI